MTAPTKMIIITSNEDVIRQFISNKAPNTRIIDLDPDIQQTSLTTDDNNMVNLNLLAEMSQLVCILVRLKQTESLKYLL